MVFFSTIILLIVLCHVLTDFTLLGFCNAFEQLAQLCTIFSLLLGEVSQFFLSRFQDFSHVFLPTLSEPFHFIFFIF